MLITTWSGPRVPQEASVVQNASNDEWIRVVSDKETELAIYEQDQTTPNKVYSLRAL
jgi:hypothetical protein